MTQNTSGGSPVLRHLSTHALPAAMLAAAVLTLAPSEAHAQQDPWFGRDKALHFAAGAAIGTGGYVLGTVAFDRRDRGVVVGLALGLGTGAAKELRDRRSTGHASWRDFAWTAAGTTVGVTAAWLIDRARHGGTVARTPLKRPLSTAE